MKIAAWNLNHRAGSRFTKYFPEAANAIGSLSVDAIVLTEYFPKTSQGKFELTLHQEFAESLTKRGFSHHLLSVETGEIANRVLIAAMDPIEIDPLPLPNFDQQMPSNSLAVRFPTTGLRLLGIRIPYYTAKKDLPRIAESWSWLESAADALRGGPSVVIGDLNVGLTSRASRGGDYFRRILASGWTRAEPSAGASYFSDKGTTTEIDHALCSKTLQFVSAEYLSKSGNAEFAGSENALSDHAVLMVDVVPN